MKKIMAENILEEVKLTDREILEAVNQYPVEAGEVKTIRTIHSTTDIIRLLDAQLLKAIPIIEKAERERVFNALEKGCGHSYKDWHSVAICDECWQALKE